MLYDYDYDLHQHTADYGGAKLRATQAVGGTGGQRQQLKTRLFTLHVPKHSSMAWIGGTSRQQGGGSATNTAAPQPYESADAKSILAKPAVLEPSHCSLLVAEASGGRVEAGQDSYTSIMTH